jgi:hypothetical protein
MPSGLSRTADYPEKFIKTEGTETKENPHRLRVG